VSLQVFDAKPLLKEALQAEVGLPVDEQKGSDILAEAVSQILQDDVQLIILVSLISFPFFSNNPHLFFL
jgi:glycogen synthase